MGEYPLAWSACLCNETIYNLLVEEGADPNHQVVMVIIITFAITIIMRQSINNSNHQVGKYYHEILNTWTSKYLNSLTLF